VAFRLFAFLNSCATTQNPPTTVDRMYVIECGENRVKDLHAKGWMLWDTGNPDRLAALPNGLTAPNGFIKSTGARLWINHDMAQSSAIPKAPAFVE
jgi:hypothetical protein